MKLGSGIKPDKGALWAQAISPALLTGERIQALVRGSAGGFSEDLVAITNVRVLGAQTASHCRIKTEIPLREVASVEKGSGLRGAGARLTMRNGSRRLVALKQMLGASDQNLTLSVLAAVTEADVPAELQSAIDVEESERALARERTGMAERGLWPNTIVVGSRPRKKAAASILAHAKRGEEPWLIIASLGAGVLAAFDDRLILIKAGAVTSAGAGAFGGQRATTFHFHDVSGIEYNSGILSGVLEVLTSSYDGTANRDFWRGSNRPRNADANDPFTLSNTLPLSKAEHAQAQPHLNELRRRITNYKRTVTIEGSVNPAFSAAVPIQGGGLADELTKLAELRNAGILTDEEFQAAKMRLLNP